MNDLVTGHLDRMDEWTLMTQEGISSSLTADKTAEAVASVLEPHAFPIERVEYYAGSFEFAKRKGDSHLLQLVYRRVYAMYRAYDPDNYFRTFWKGQERSSAYEAFFARLKAFLETLVEHITAVLPTKERELLFRFG